MKKAINNKIYNTETAHLLSKWDNGMSESDFGFVEESLYQKRTGEFFIFGRGGARTKYSKPEGNNSWSGGCKIVPLSYDSAQQWAEEHMELEEYQKVFGLPEEETGNTAVTLSMSTMTIEKTRIEATKRGQTLSQYVEALLESNLKD